MAIEDSPGKALPVKEIYGWILDHFPFYKIAPIGWKNSVRHNLSLNKCFRKVEKAPVSVVYGFNSQNILCVCYILFYTLIDLYCKIYFCIAFRSEHDVNNFYVNIIIHI